MNHYAIIVAAGKGLRMQSELPKQFMEVQEKPLLFYAIEAFTAAIPGIQIRLVLPASGMDIGKRITAQFLPEHGIQLIPGGETRFHSVQNGLAGIPEEEGLVFVHDGVRPLVSVELIRHCMSEALENGNAVPALEVSDSVRTWNGKAYVPLDRSLLRSVQTPQVFSVGMLKRAFLQSYQPGFTDEATVVERAGIPVNLIPGEAENIKVTHPPDFITAQTLLALRAARGGQHKRG